MCALQIGEIKRETGMPQFVYFHLTKNAHRRNLRTIEALRAASIGCQVALSMQNLLWCLVGCMLGTAVGVLPGVGPAVTVALLLPITTKVDDPVYFTRPYLTSSDFKKLPGAAGWNPTPCTA